MNAMQIIREVARQHLLTVDELRGPCKQTRFTTARITAAKALKQQRGLDNGRIGRLLNRTTWTIRYYVNDEFRERKRRGMLRGQA